MHIFKVYESLSNLVILIVFYWVISVECEQLLPRRIFTRAKTKTCTLCCSKSCALPPSENTFMTVGPNQIMSPLFTALSVKESKWTDLG